MRVSLQCSTSAMGTSLKVTREGVGSGIDDRFRNIILSFEALEIGGVSITLSPEEARVLVERLRDALRQ